MAKTLLVSVDVGKFSEQNLSAEATAILEPSSDLEADPTPSAIAAMVQPFCKSILSE